MKRLSVIIVTYHSEKDIYDCLASVWNCCDIAREELEVIVVDNSPVCEPMFSQLRAQYGTDIVLVHNTHNGGYGQGNNVGIRRATAPVVLIMNPDVRLAEPLFKTALDAFRNDSQLCMYGMKQMLSEQVKSPLSFDCSRRLNGYLIPLVSSFCNKLDWYVPRYMYLQGSCFFISKEKFSQIGLFDEDIFMYGEEDDIHWRMARQFGAHIIYNPRLRYLHLTLERPMSLATEKKMVQSTARVNAKRGIPVKQTIRNYICYYRIRYWSALVKRMLHKKGSDVTVAILNDLLTDLKAQCSS